MILPDDNLAVIMKNDNDDGTYECNKYSCGYTGNLYCQNCGYEKGEV